MKASFGGSCHQSLRPPWSFSTGICFAVDLLGEDLSRSEATGGLSFLGGVMVFYKLPLEHSVSSVCTKIQTNLMAKAFLLAGPLYAQEGWPLSSLVACSSLSFRAQPVLSYAKLNCNISSTTVQSRFFT